MKSPCSDDNDLIDCSALHALSRPHPNLPVGRAPGRDDNLHEAENASSAWFDASSMSPMVTHCHASKVPAGRSLPRVRSRSLGDAEHSMELQHFLERDGSSSTDLMGSLVQSEDEIKESVEESPEVDEEGNPVWISIIYGLINSTIVLPVLMSFGNIIYSDAIFAPFMPILIKLTVVSGMVHQICFSTLSSLPFAVGQVQDAGLIFLSQMSRNIGKHCLDNGHDEATMLATVTVGLGIATAMLGFGLVLLGKARLAQYVQALPTPVVGGYLAYIGWFCGKSGILLMAGGNDLTVQIFALRWMYILPGLMGGVLIYLLVRRLRHMAVLPVSIIFILIMFYMGLWISGKSIKQATENGWIRASDSPPVWYHTWDYVRFKEVEWSALPPQWPTLLSMIFVVAVSSSLDVAAIELEMKKPLDYNHELKMVGISNIASGLMAGYTGSYIFSQSIFSLRAGIRSRLSGYVIALCELIVIVLPFPVLDYIPSFFFGSLLTIICIDLMAEWLWEVRLKLTKPEYCICMSTFLLIQAIGVEFGILAGIILFIALRRMGVELQASNAINDPEGSSTKELASYGSMRNGSTKPKHESRISTTNNHGTGKT